MGDANREVQGTQAATDQWLDSTLEQVFISPRVIDERAYEELSGSLRTLMKDAAGQSRALIQTTGEVKLLGSQLREATQQLQSKVETAVRVIPTLDQRMKQAETLLEVTGKDLEAKVTAIQEAATRAVPLERERIAAQLREQVEVIRKEVMREQLKLLRDFVSKEMAVIEKDVDARLQKFLKPLMEAGESLTLKLAEVESRSQAMRQRFVEDEARLAAAAAALKERLDLATSQASGLEAIAARVAESVSRAEAMQNSIESAVSEAGVQLGAGLSAAERRADLLTANLEKQLEAVNAALSALHAEVEAAASVKALAAPDPESLEKLGRWLQQLIEQGDKIGRGLTVLLQRAGK